MEYSSHNTHVLMCLSSEVMNLHSNLPGVCVIWGMFCNLCLSFLISRMRSAVAFMAWDYGLAGHSERMLEISLATRPRTRVLKTTSSDFRCSLWYSLGPTLCAIPTAPGLPMSAGFGLSMVPLIRVDSEFFYPFHTPEG